MKIKVLLLCTVCAFTSLSCSDNEELSEFNCCINTDACIERSISTLTIIPNRYTVNIDKNTIQLYSLNCVHPFTIHIKENNFEYIKNYIEYAINNNLFLDVCISNNEIYKISISVNKWESDETNSYTRNSNESQFDITEGILKNIVWEKIKRKASFLFQFYDDGCYARAHYLRKLSSEGDMGIFFSKKCFVFGDITIANNDSLYTWRYHVAISLRVKMENGEIKTMILDPSLNPDGPITLAEWLDILRKDSKKDNNEFQIIECDSRIFIINPNNHQEYIFDDNYEMTDYVLSNLK